MTFFFEKKLSSFFWRKFTQNLDIGTYFDSVIAEKNFPPRISATEQSISWICSQFEVYDLGVLKPESTANILTPPPPPINSCKGHPSNVFKYLGIHKRKQQILVVFFYQYTTLIKQRIWPTINTRLMPDSFTSTSVLRHHCVSRNRTVLVSHWLFCPMFSEILHN